MRLKSKRQYRVCSIFDHKAMENHYESMASKGWILKSRNGIEEYYEKETGRNLNYLVTVDRKNFKRSELIKSIEDFGWTYVTADGQGILIFSSQENEAKRPYSGCKEFEILSHAIKNKHRQFSFLLNYSLILVLMQMYLMDVSKLTGPGLGLYMVLPIVIAVFFWQSSSGDLKWLKANESSEGEIIRTPNDQTEKRIAEKTKYLGFIALIFFALILLNYESNLMILYVMLLGLTIWSSINIFKELELQIYKILTRRLVQSSILLILWTLVFLISSSAITTMFGPEDSKGDMVFESHSNNVLMVSNQEIRFTNSEEDIYFYGEKHVAKFSIVASWLERLYVKKFADRDLEMKSIDVTNYPVDSITAVTVLNAYIIKDGNTIYYIGHNSEDALDYIINDLKLIDTPWETLDI